MKYENDTASIDLDNGEDEDLNKMAEDLEKCGGDFEKYKKMKNKELDPNRIILMINKNEDKILNLKRKRYVDRFHKVVFEKYKRLDLKGKLSDEIEEIITDIVNTYADSDKKRITLLNDLVEKHKDSIFTINTKIKDLEYINKCLYKEFKRVQSVLDEYYG